MFKFADERDWFLRKRFGMFLHWGIYSVGGWHEQEWQRRGMSREQYLKYADMFNPVDFNPRQWLDLMQDAGMEYVCLTTKHHDGFCLWDTGQTSFNCMNTPYKKDIVGMLAEECHSRQVPLVLYYSVVDWHQPNYPNQGRHHELPTPTDASQQDWGKYMEFLKAQIRELCTNYGKIGGIWWDMNVPEVKDPSVDALIRSLQPGAVINNRGFSDGDFGTPERDWGEKETAGAARFATPVEACQSVGSQSWSYRENEDYFSAAYLTRAIDSFLARGANYLLNVGPDGRGVIPPPARRLLRRVGGWMGRVKESLYNTQPLSDFTGRRQCWFTTSGNSLYAHFRSPTETRRLNLYPLAHEPLRVTLLNTGEVLPWELSLLPENCWKGREKTISVSDIPLSLGGEEALVVKLEFAQLPEFLSQAAGRAEGVSSASHVAKAEG